MTAAEQWSCTNITVVKCQICMYDGHTLQSLAAEYQTDYLALYSMNVGIPNPDRCECGVCVNIQTYTYKQYIYIYMVTFVDDGTQTQKQTFTSSSLMG